MSVREYFSRSPFRSVSFITSTLLVGVFVVWALHVEKAIRSLQPCASNVVFGLVVFALLAWLYGLLLHGEIRSLLKDTERAPLYSRLDQLHQILILLFLVMGVWIVLQLTVLCYGKKV
jgi:hypothetical protein